ncbi:hypothetical protein [Variovorax gossypii]
MRALLFSLMLPLGVACSNTAPGKAPGEEARALPAEAQASFRVPAIATYEARIGASECRDPAAQPGDCAEQIPNFRSKYWRLVLQEVPGGVGTETPGQPSVADLLLTAVRREDSVLAQSLYVRRGTEAMELPISSSRLVNGKFRGEGVALRPDALTPWVLGAKEAVEEVRVAALSTVVTKETSNFVQVFSGAATALAVINPATAGALAIPGVRQAIGAFDQMEQKLNEARSGTANFTVQTIQIYPRYLKELNVYVRHPDGTIGPQRLYQVRVASRNSLFLSNLDDKAMLSVIHGYDLASTGVQPPTRLINELKKRVPVTDKEVITGAHCKAFLVEAGAMGLNDLDQTLAAATWLDSLSWNMLRERRDGTGVCYELLSPMLNAANKELLIPDGKLAPEGPDRQLQDTALGEITVIFNGENTAMSKRRFLPTVRVESAERNEILNDYFQADLEAEGAVFTSGQLADLFQAQPASPLQFNRKTPCYRVASKDTSSMTIETRCMVVMDKSGAAQPYKVTLALDRSLVNEPDRAAVRVIRFSKLP